jgi:transcriptional regulator with XRE-family HTH domain
MGRPTAADELIGQRIRQRRLEMHVSQTDLGECIGVSYQQIQKYETGMNRVGSGQLALIARALQVDTQFFFGDLGGKPRESKIIAFLATKDGVDINEAMIRLTNPDHRRAVIDLARKLGKPLLHEAS